MTMIGRKVVHRPAVVTVSVGGVMMAGMEDIGDSALDGSYGGRYPLALRMLIHNCRLFLATRLNVFLLFLICRIAVQMEEVHALAVVSRWPLDCKVLVNEENVPHSELELLSIGVYPTIYGCRTSPISSMTTR